MFIWIGNELMNKYTGYKAKKHRASNYVNLGLKLYGITKFLDDFFDMNKRVSETK